MGLIMHGFRYWTAPERAWSVAAVALSLQVIIDITLVIVALLQSARMALPGAAIRFIVSATAATLFLLRVWWPLWVVGSMALLTALFTLVFVFFSFGDGTMKFDFTPAALAFAMVEATLGSMLLASAIRRAWQSG